MFKAFFRNFALCFTITFQPLSHSSHYRSIFSSIRSRHVLVVESFIRLFARYVRSQGKVKSSDYRKRVVPTPKV